MKSIIYYLSTCILALFVISCSGPDVEPIADATIDDISVEITSRSLEAENSPEEMDSLLIRKWSNESSEISFNLISDNSFQGTFDTDNTVEGKWHISEDLLSLNFESILSDGTSPFELTYTIVEISDTNMTVQDKQGNEIQFISTK
jgi:hypothetical protein